MSSERHNTGCMKGLENGVLSAIANLDAVGKNDAYLGRSEDFQSDGTGSEMNEANKDLVLPPSGLRLGVLENCRLNSDPFKIISEFQI